ncbi:hypothetical protein BCY84_09199 [Trypanosoma cruzi cruzi]|nr:hypothetical protein BCY84_09199 [Trypanosoma cruzi cruzi]
MAVGCDAATWVCPGPCVSFTASGLLCDAAIWQQERCQWSCVLCRDLATLNGGCVELRGRWEGEGVTGVVASVLFCVGGCALVGTVCGWMLLRANFFICCCLCLPFLRSSR